MRIFKPKKIGLIHRTYSRDKKHFLVVSPMIFFDLKKNSSVLSEAEGWSRAMKIMTPGEYIDEGMPKTKSEVLIFGKVHSPNGEPVRELEAGFTLGSLEKNLVVSGDRIWQKKFLRYRKTEPAPFVSMPLSWERGWGESGDPVNPEGTGPMTADTDGFIKVALPNFEYPGDRTSKPGKRIEPAGFGPIGMSAACRRNFAGTYDDEYFGKDFPDLPADMDFKLYNRASPDQQTSAGFEGSETFSLTNLHSEFSSIQGSLPGFRARCFAEDNAGIKEIETNPETVIFLPEAEMGLVICRGQCLVEERLAAQQIRHLMFAYENLSDLPRPKNYYESALLERIDPESALYSIMRDSDLSPEKGPEQILEEENAHGKEIDRINKDMEEGWQSYREEMREEYDVDVPEGEAPPPIDPRYVVSPLAKETGDLDLAPMVEASRERIAEAEEKLGTPIKDKLNGIPGLNDALKEAENQEDSDSENEKKEKKDLVRKATETAKNRSSLVDGLISTNSFFPDAPDNLDDSTFPPEQPLQMIAQEKADEIRKMELAGRRLAVEPSSESRKKAGCAGKALREVMLELIAAGENLTERDFSGADLSRIDFSGMDLTGSIFENANLREAQFGGASLSDVSFVGAELSGTFFSGAKLTNANLNSVSGAGVFFRDTDLTGVQMIGAKIRESLFTGSLVCNVNAFEAEIRESDLTKCKISDTGFMKSDLSGSDFSGSLVNRCIFSDANLMLSRWNESKLSQAVFCDTNIQMALSINCEFSRCQFAGETFLTGCQFSESYFEDCGLRNVWAGSSSWQGAKLIRCDLGSMKMSGTDLSNVVIYECIAHETDFQGAVLKETVLASSQCSGARFVNAQLEGTNFHDSDVLLSDFSGSNYLSAKNIMALKLKRLEDEYRSVA